MTAIGTDYAAWAEETAQAIRERRFEALDLEAVAEEIRSLGSSERGEVDSQLTQLLMHLLKWQHQPEYRTMYGERSWRLSITNQRVALGRAFRRSPSLWRYAEEQLPELYADAIKLAEAETGMTSAFPAVCPYTLEQALDSGFYPG